jgi:cell division protein FtsB
MSTKVKITAALVVMGSLLLVILFTENGLVDLMRFRDQQQILEQKNKLLTQQNLQLYHTIERLRTDTDFIADIARKEFGMIGKNEIIFKIEPQKQGGSP